MGSDGQVLERRHGDVVELRLFNPPLNVLSIGAGLVDALHAALDRAVAAPEVTAIVLTGEGGTFCAGADIRDFDDDPAGLDRIRALTDAVENSPKPVIAAIEGACLGGGLELAMAAHVRVAASTATFGFPEVTLGLLPGSGGTQRAPRLMGAAAALDLMLSGKVIKAEAALQAGVIDRIGAGNVLDEALSLASDAAAFTRRSGELAIDAQAAEAIAAARARPGLSVAAEAIVDCVEAARTVPLAQGLAIEARLFGELMASETSRALRHGFFGRRTVRRVPGLSAADARPIAEVTVIGGGLMGTGIAIALLNAGLKVAVVEPSADQQAKARSTVEKTIARDVGKGRIAPQIGEARLAALRIEGDLAQAAGADLFIEAIFEDMEAKRAVFERLDQLARPGAILASNTSTLDLDRIAAFTARPEDVVGLHFFSPANVMRLLEIVRGAKTSPETLASAMHFARQIGKTGVVAGVCDGFIGNRVFEEYLRQAWFLLEEGALPQQVDRALEAFGMAMGPCRVMDLAGQDIGWKIRQRRAVEQPDRPYSRIPDLVCELGRFGQKTGAGFYRYPDGRTPEVDPEIDALILAESARIGLARREIEDTEIVERCLYAMANEGARIVEEDVAYRPVDVDVIYLDGYGFPAARGGPMFQADERGLNAVLTSMRRFAEGHHGWAWEPAKLLVDLAESGRRFADLDAA